jgi:C4-dicarboxylate-specific signal transduction histidine kinase
MLESDVRFFGRITAGISHDLNNVLSIISEYSGLLGDLLEMAKQGQAADYQRLEGITEDVGRQVMRGKEIIRTLNRFAHSVDEPLRTFPLEALVSDIAGMSAHFAKLRNIRIEARLPSQPLSVSTDPFRLQRALFVCLWTLIENQTANSPIVVSCEARSGAAVVTMSGGPVEESGKAMDGVRSAIELLKGLGGTVNAMFRPDGTSSCVVSLPARTDNPG